MKIGLTHQPEYNLLYKGFFHKGYNILNIGSLGITHGVNKQYRVQVDPTSVDLINQAVGGKWNWGDKG